MRCLSRSAPKAAVVTRIEASRPTRPRVVGDRGALSVPALHGGELEIRSVFSDQFHRSVNERGFVEIGASVVGVAAVDQRDLRLALGDDQGVVPVIAPLHVLGDEVEKRFVDDCSARRVDEHALGPERAAVGVVAIERGADGTQPLLDQAGVLAGRDLRAV